MAAAPDAPIGVFDSGVGGLTVVRALRAALPAEAVIYLGDTARLPYGTKSPETVIRYAGQLAHHLRAEGVKYIVVACNTASACAIGPLRARLPVPVTGVVVPGARAAARASAGGAIGVLGTLGTVASGAYERAIREARPGARVAAQACPLLVPLAEEGWLDHPVTADVARHYLGELRARAGDLDTLVLGCTHYPLLAPVLGRVAAEVFGHPVALVDSADATARAVAADLAARRLARPPATSPGPVRYQLTDASRFAEVAGRFLGEAGPVAVERADLAAGPPALAAAAASAYKPAS